MKTFISPKIHGRYRQDTDMYKTKKQNNNTQCALQHGSGYYYIVTILCTVQKVSMPTDYSISNVRLTSILVNII